MKKISDRVYAALVPKERFKASLSALARGDDAEVKKLRESCPKFAYEIPDAAFGDQMRGVFVLAQSVLVDLMRAERGFSACVNLADLYQMADSGVVAAQKAVVIGLKAGFAEAGPGYSLPDEKWAAMIEPPAGDQANKYWRCAQYLKRVIAALLAGLDEWLKEIELTLPDLAGVAPLLVEEAEALRSLVDGIEPDQGLREQQAGILREHWARITRQAG